MTRHLTAAAARYTRTVAATHNRTNTSAQRAAWDDWRCTPEVQFIATWMGNAMSGARLYAARRAPDGSIQALPHGHRATELVATIAGGPEGQAEMLREFGAHLVVAGEGWIVLRPHDQGEDWHVLSVLEIAPKGKGMEAEIDGVPLLIPAHDSDTAVDPLAPAAIRVWNPSPARYLEAHSPVIGAREQLDELRLLTEAVKAITRSRLTGRGVLLVPKGTRFPTAPGQEEAEDDLLDVFMDVAGTAIREPESAAATVPIILEVPAEAIAGIQQLTFESHFDELAIKLREEVIRRFANAVEIPAEILLGQGDANHWSAWALKEEAIRLGVEPRLGTLAHALTSSWLRPILDAEGAPDASEVMVWYDTSPLRVRANRSQTALELFDRNAISAIALRRETGFDEADAPTVTPRPEQPEAPMPTPAAPRLPVDETHAEPDTLPASATPNPGLLEAADGLVWHALSRAGEKLARTPACPRSQRAAVRAIDPAMLHTKVPVTAEQADEWRLLDGSWTRVPEIAGRYGADPDCLAASLTDYCRALISTGLTHQWQATARVISPCADTSQGQEREAA